jgi:hypothetical protein
MGEVCDDAIILLPAVFVRQLLCRDLMKLIGRDVLFRSVIIQNDQ